MYYCHNGNCQRGWVGQKYALLPCGNCQQGWVSQKYKLLPLWELSTRMNGSKVLSSIACSPYCRPRAINWSTDFQSETEIKVLTTFPSLCCNPFIILIISYMPQFFTILFWSLKVICPSSLQSFYHPYYYKLYVPILCNPFLIICSFNISLWFFRCPNPPILSILGFRTFKTFGI